MTKRVHQKCIESFSLLVSFEGYGGENRSICMSFKSPVAGTGKNKSATTDVKFRTKTPVNKELSYILRTKSHWKRRKCAKISAFG